MAIRLYESELKVMDALWQGGELSASDLAKILKQQTDWNRNTTYTVIKKLVEKGAVERREPGFLCRPLLSREEVQRQEAGELINRMFDGSAELFFSSFLGAKKLSEQEAERLHRMIDTLK